MEYLKWGVGLNRHMTLDVSDRPKVKGLRVQLMCTVQDNHVDCGERTMVLEPIVIPSKKFAPVFEALYPQVGPAEEECAYRTPFHDKEEHEIQVHMIATNLRHVSLAWGHVHMPGLNREPSSAFVRERMGLASANGGRSNRWGLTAHWRVRWLSPPLRI